ncbi:ABC transporter permease [Roseiterribacter gracilis]|uniref:ABC transporter permease n=1 Tax=Roseiterribacter gracilis TaxID=2812848 RepID=A0A8S8X6P8_9PROT|nr:ABC transporter permease [Rhodospirillales bacterium TMPK1]
MHAPAAPEQKRARKRVIDSRPQLLALQAFVLLGFFMLWHVLTATGLLNPFFFATPLGVLERTAKDLATAAFYRHLGITFLETVLAFAIGTVAGIVIGFWFARAPLVSAVFDPYVKAANAVPRVVLAPIFALWLGLGIWSKVALGVSLTFFIVFFNVYQGVKEVSPVILANARMLGMNSRQLLRHVYLPSAMSWVFSSLHTAVGFALVGAVVGEYLGASAGLGYRIAQAEGVFDTVGVFSGMLVLTLFVIVIDSAVSAIESKLLRWRPQTSATVSTH